MYELYGCDGVKTYALAKSFLKGHSLDPSSF